MRGLRICQDPHIPPISVTSGQRTNENMHSLNIAKQVIMCHDLCVTYLVVSLFLVPFTCFVGWHIQGWVLGKTITPSLVSRRAQTLFFFQNCHNYSGGIYLGRGTCCCGNRNLTRLVMSRTLNNNCGIIEQR